MGADIFRGARDLCPRGRVDLAAVIRLHLAECTLMRVQARETRDRARQQGQGAAPDDSSPPDESRKAVQKSQRLRETVREMLDAALLVGRDYLPMKSVRPAGDHRPVLTAPADRGIIRDDGLGQPSPPGPTS